MCKNVVCLEGFGFGFCFSSQQMKFDLCFSVNIQHNTWNYIQGISLWFEPINFTKGSLGERYLQSGSEQSLTLGFQNTGPSPAFPPPHPVWPHWLAAFYLSCRSKIKSSEKKPAFLLLSGSALGDLSFSVKEQRIVPDVVIIYGTAFFLPRYDKIPPPSGLSAQ